MSPSPTYELESGGFEIRASVRLTGTGKQPRGPWVPPWGWVLLAAAVFHQILRKDPREEATGQRIATSSPSGLTASPAQGPSQGGARVHRV